MHVCLKNHSDNEWLSSIPGQRSLVNIEFTRNIDPLDLEAIAASLTVSIAIPTHIGIMTFIGTTFTEGIDFSSNPQSKYHIF